VGFGQSGGVNHPAAIELAVAHEQLHPADEVIERGADAAGRSLRVWLAREF
jgi:hypothetical protein